MNLGDATSYLKDLELWAVVCTEKHTAIGPFEGQEAAQELCAAMSLADGECVYEAVPFILVLNKEKLAEAVSLIPTRLEV